MEDYLHILRKANLSEKYNPKMTLDLLKECVELYTKSEEIQKKRPYDLSILKMRISYLENLLEKYPHLKENLSTPSIPYYHSLNSSESFISETQTQTQSQLIAPIETSPTPLPEIINFVYSRLKIKERIEYQDYLEFYKEVNKLIPEAIDPVIYDHSNCVYFIGDTHGSYEESLIMVSFFEKIIEKNPKVKIVFLGDYVDRNPYDLENVTLLIGFWLHYKENVILLRGNHEDVSINKAYGFINNLKEAFMIPQLINALYREILTVFIHLPIVVVFSLETNQEGETRKIFAVHGGIPINPENVEIPVIIDEIKDKIRKNAESYSEFDIYLNWLLWADPDEMDDSIVYDAYTGRSHFGITAFNKFMDANGFDLMVRAHQKWDEGYKFFFNGRLLSLFSTSYYNNIKRWNAAFVKIEEDKDPFILRPTEELLNSVK